MQPDWRTIDPALSSREFGRAYADVIDAWLRMLFADAPAGVALAAVGSYGRREVAPFSDLDLVILHDGKSDVGKFAEEFWYPVWDGPTRVDHSVRTPKEAIAVARDNLEVATGLLELRAIAGDASIVEQLRATSMERWRETLPRRVRDLFEATEQRSERAGEVAFLLEPDLKEGKGGLRDVQTLRALAGATPVADDLVGEALAYAQGILLDCRLALQRETGRAGERLTLQDQDAVAATLGYGNADELMGAVSSAARTIAWSLDECFRRVQSWLTGPTGKAGGRQRAIGWGLVTRDGELAVHGLDPSGDPTLLLRAGAAAAVSGLPIEPATLERLAEHAPPMPDPWPVVARQALVQLLGMGHAAVPVLEAFDHYDLISRCIPEWSAVRAKPQRNAYHRYTVDRHLIEAAAQAALLARDVARPDLLLVGALFHDIGKGFPGDHTDAGVEVMRKLGPRLGFDEADVARLVSLIRLHLLLPEVATRRDLDEPATLEMVRDEVGDVETLELLSALAKADSIVTGPAAWSPWKAGLVNELVNRTRALFQGGPMPEPSARSLMDEHRELVVTGRVRVHPIDGAVLVTAQDQPGLLAMIAGTLSVHKLDVLSAMVASEDGMAVDRFEIVPSFGDLPDWQQVEADLNAALDNRFPLADKLRERYLAYATTRARASAIVAGPRVIFDDEASPRATRIEVRCADSAGLLFRLASALTACNLDIRSTKVATLGHEVVDTFYVMTHGAKVDDPVLRTQVEAALLAAVHPD